MTKKSILSIVFFLAIFSLLGMAESKIAIAGTISGWLWGGNEEIVGAGGLGWISMSSGAPISYNVAIDDSSGNLSGYAWSANIGWISFNAADLAGCPSAPCNAKIANDGSLSGWAKMINQADSWMSLSGAAGVTYGVRKVVTTTVPYFSGYAWSDSFGWIYWGDANNIIATETGCVPNSDPADFVCYKADKESCNNPANRGKTIIEKQVTCLKTNNCKKYYGTSVADLLACDAGGATIDGIKCSENTDDRTTCSFYGNGGWREVAP